MNSEPLKPSPPSILREAEDLIQRGRPDEARRLLAGKPGSASRVILARLAARAGDLNSAVEHYREALSRDGGNLAALRALASAALSGGRPGEAKEMLDRWAAVDADDPDLEDQLEQWERLDQSSVEPDRPLPVAAELEELLTRPDPATRRSAEIIEGELLAAPALADPDLWDLGDEFDAKRENKED